MRRKDREITDKKILEEILKRNKVCVVAFGGEVPYAVPMNYGYDAGTFYLHSAKAGKKIDLLKKNPNVNLVIYEDKGLVTADTACDYGYRFSSVICTGKAEFVESASGKEEALKKMMELIAGMKNTAFKPGEIERVHVIKVKVLEISGKRK